MFEGLRPRHPISRWTEYQMGYRRRLLLLVCSRTGIRMKERRVTVAARSVEVIRPYYHLEGSISYQDINENGLGSQAINFTIHHSLLFTLIALHTHQPRLT
jgi:hypothetical protein